MSYPRYGCALDGVYGLARQNGVVCSPKCMFFAEYSLLAMFDTYPASKCTTQNMYTRVCAGVVVIVSLRTALSSLKEEEEERKKKTKMNNLRGRRFRFITLETSVSRAKGLFKLRKFAWSFLDGWNFDKRQDSEDLQHLLESRHLDLRRRTSDFGDFNGLLGSAYPQEKSWDS